MTLKLDSGNYLRFQADTGAQCNVVPVKLYKKATKDTHLTSLKPCRSQITAYGGATIPVIGTVLLPVQRGNIRCTLHCKIVQHDNIRPILGRQACLGMKIVSYLDNDELNKPSTDNAIVYALDSTTQLTVDQL